MGKYSLWENKDESCTMFIDNKNIPDLTARGLMDGFIKITELEADDWVAAKQKQHEYQGLEEHQPMPDELEPEKLAAMTLEHRLWYSGQRAAYAKASQQKDYKAMRKILESVFMAEEEIVKLFETF